MKESLVKLVVIVIALFSLFVGGAFLLIPGWISNYVGITGDVAWLRTAGAATVGIQGFGLLVTAFRRRDTNPLLGIVSLTTTVEMGVLWFSLFTAEYGEMSRWAVVALGILITIGAGLLWISWVSRRRSVGTLPPKGAKQVKQGDPPVPDPALVEEIDGQSPRSQE